MSQVVVNRAAVSRATVSRAAVGRALCIGVAAEADARRLAALAIERGFGAPALLLNEAATRASVRAKVMEMAALSEPGDLFVLTFSGHGGSTCGQGMWQLYDGKLNDEQLKADLALFRGGVRVLVVSDNCGGGIPALRECDLAASVLVLAACEEGRYADGEGLPGHFIAAVTRALNNSETYGAFYEALCSGMPAYQRPDYYRVGVPDAAFEAQQPFTI